MLNVRREKAGIYPVLEVEVNGKWARLSFDNKLTVLDEFGLLFLGAEFEGDKQYRHAIPADEADGRGAMVLEGFTDDPEIIAVFREWLDGFNG